MVCAAHGQACGLLGVGQDESRRFCTLRQQRVDGDGALTELSAEHQHLGTLGLELLQGVQTAGQAALWAGTAISTRPSFTVCS